MSWMLVLLLSLLATWFALVTFHQLQLRREMRMLIVQVRKIAGDRHIGGTTTGSFVRRLSRRIDFRVDVELDGFLRVGEHARVCRIVDLSESGCQVITKKAGLPLDAEGVLTIEFSEFGSGSTRARVAREVRSIDDEMAYGLKFEEPEADFVRRVHDTIRDILSSIAP